MQVRVEKQDGRTYYLAHTESEQTREYGKIAQAEIDVDRESVKGIPLDEGNDRVYLRNEPTREDDWQEMETDAWYGENAFYDAENARAQLTDGTAYDEGRLLYADYVASDEVHIEFDFEVAGDAETYPDQWVNVSFFADEWVDVETPEQGLIAQFDYETSTARLRFRDGSEQEIINIDVDLQSGQLYTGYVTFDHGEITLGVEGENEGTTYIEDHYGQVGSTPFDDYYFGPYVTIASQVDNDGTGASSLFIHRTELTYDEFGGVLGEVERHGAETTLIADSFERRAVNAEPSGGAKEYINANNDTIIRDAIEGIPEIGRGHIDRYTLDTFDLIFNHESPGKMIRTVTNELGGEPFYQPNQRLDYIHNPERPIAVEINPDEGNIDGKFNVVQNSSEQRVTHLKMLGAGEGDHQITTTVVAESWEEGDPQVWETRANKDITSESMLQSHAETLIQELGRKHIEIDARVVGESMTKGRKPTVRYGEEGINADLHVVKSTKRVSVDGVQWDVTFSNRRFSRGRNTPSRERADINRYNRAMDGQVVPLSVNGGRQTIDSNGDYRMQVYYPSDVEDELRMELRVVGQAYRASISGVSNAHTRKPLGATNTGRIVWPTGSVQNVSYGTEAVHNYVPGTEGNFSGCTARFDYHNKTGSTQTMNWRVVNSAYGGIIYQDEGWTIEDDEFVTRVEEFNTDFVSAGDELIFDIEGGIGTESGADHLGSMEFEVASHSDGTGTEHNHAVRRGLQQFSNFPSECYAYVNGNLVTPNSFGTDGGGEWTETIDIYDEMTPGQMNEIRVSSNTLGDMQAYVDGDIYRLITRDS